MIIVPLTSTTQATRYCRLFLRTPMPRQNPTVRLNEDESEAEAEAAGTMTRQRIISCIVMF